MIEINNLTRFKFDKKRLEEVSRKVLEGESSFAPPSLKLRRTSKATKDKEKAFDLSITFVGEKEIQKLNKKYRKINRPTDVLSFTYEKSGEVIICPPVVKKNAKNFGEFSEKELERVLIHGILHILGYDHEKKDGIMIKKQEYYLANLKFKYQNLK